MVVLREGLKPFVQYDLVRLSESWAEFRPPQETGSGFLRFPGFQKADHFRCFYDRIIFTSKALRDSEFAS